MGMVGAIATAAAGTGFGAAAGALAAARPSSGEEGVPGAVETAARRWLARELSHTAVFAAGLCAFGTGLAVARGPHSFLAGFLGAATLATAAGVAAHAASAT
jgi:hypothetical protein